MACLAEQGLNGQAEFLTVDKNLFNLIVGLLSLSQGFFQNLLVSKAQERALQEAKQIDDYLHSFFHWNVHRLHTLFFNCFSSFSMSTGCVLSFCLVFGHERAFTDSLKRRPIKLNSSKHNVAAWGNLYYFVRNKGKSHYWSRWEFAVNGFSDDVLSFHINCYLDFVGIPLLVDCKAFDGISTISVLLVQNRWCGLFSLMVGTVLLCPYTVHTSKRFVPYWYKVCTIGTDGKERNPL